MNTRGQSSQDRGWNRGRQQRGRGKSRGRGRANVHYTDGGPEQVRQEEKGQDQQDGDFYVFSVNSSNYKNDIELILNNTSITGVIDSGSDCSLMSIETFKSVNKQGNLNVNKGTQNVYLCGSEVPLETVGICEIKCKVKSTGSQKMIKFTLVPKAVPTLISRQDSIQLGFLRIGGDLAYNVKSVNSKIMTNMKTKYPSVFSGLGNLRDYKLRLHFDQSVMPMAQPVRRILFSRLQKVVDKLKKLESLDVIERVQNPTCWVNPLVSVEKP